MQRKHSASQRNGNSMQKKHSVERGPPNSFKRRAGKRPMGRMDGGGAARACSGAWKRDGGPLGSRSEGQQQGQGSERKSARQIRDGEYQGRRTKREHPTQMGTECVMP